MDPFFLELLGVLFRWALTALGGYLVAHHVFTTDQADRYTAELMRHILLGLPVATGLALGLWAKYKSRLKFIAAADAPSGASEASINESAKTAGVKAQVFTGPIQEKTQ